MDQGSKFCCEGWIPILVSGIMVLLRLDCSYEITLVNANALLHALGVSPSKHSEYLDHPISQARLAARHIVQSSTSGMEYSNGVSGIWVHLSEAREFARRAKLAGGSLLASVLREDLFQLVCLSLPWGTQELIAGSLQLSLKSSLIIRLLNRLVYR